MKMGFAAVLAFSLLLVTTEAFGGVGQAQSATGAIAQDQDLAPTPKLVKEIQTMLARLGLDPGPADGNPQKRTNHAVRLFEAMHNLPVTELKRGEIVPAELIAVLRSQTSRTIPGRAEKVPGGPPRTPAKVAQPPVLEERPAAKTWTEAVAPAAPKPPSQDIVASCSYDPEDFHIGPNRYTPESFLQEGFDGSVTHAVARLEDGLEKSRQIADRIGVSALNEVQRQARVVQYFQCRLRGEQVPPKEK